MALINVFVAYAELGKPSDRIFILQDGAPRVDEKTSSVVRFLLMCKEYTLCWLQSAFVMLKCRNY